LPLSTQAGALLQAITITVCGGLIIVIEFFLGGIYGGGMLLLARREDNPGSFWFGIALQALLLVLALAVALRSKKWGEGLARHVVLGFGGLQDRLCAGCGKQVAID
jgi:hypothetical protein